MPSFAQFSLNLLGCRRRTRERSAAAAGAAEPVQPNPEAWEFAINFGKTFHSNNKRSDCVRRRRWHREAIAVEWHAESVAGGTVKDDVTVSEAPAVLTVSVDRYTSTHSHTRRYT